MYIAAQLGLFRQRAGTDPKILPESEQQPTGADSKPEASELPSPNCTPCLASAAAVLSEPTAPAVP